MKVPESDEARNTGCEVSARAEGPRAIVLSWAGVHSKASRDNHVALPILPGPLAHLPARLPSWRNSLGGLCALEQTLTEVGKFGD